MARKNRAEDFDTWLQRGDERNDQPQGRRVQAEDFGAWLEREGSTPHSARYITPEMNSDRLREIAMQKAARRNYGTWYDRTQNAVSKLREDRESANAFMQKDYRENQSQLKARMEGAENKLKKDREKADAFRQKDYLKNQAQLFRAGQEETGTASFSGDIYLGNRDILNPVLEQMSREKAFRDMFADQNAVTGHEVIDQLLGLEQRTPAEEKPEHIQRIENLSAEEIKERQRSYNDKMTNDIDTAKRLLEITFAGQETDRSNAYVNGLRDSLGERWGFDAYDADALQSFVDRAERGVIYTDSTGNETTWDSLYINARNREDAEANALTPEDQQELQRLYGMSSSELERQYRAQDENARTEDLNTARNLLNYTNPWMEYDDPEVLKARQTLKDAYGIDPTDFDQLRNLIDELEQREQSDIIYTDSTGHNYTYQDLYYNADNREKFSEMRDDEGALTLLTEGFRLSKQIDEYTADIADSGSAKNYTPLIQDAKQKMNIIADQLSRKGYDMDRLIGYLNTEQAKQDFLMQSQANKDFAKDNPVLASLASIFATPVMALEWATNTTGSGNPEDLQNYVPPNYYGMDATNFSQDVRGATAQEIKDEMRLAGFDDKFVNLATSVYSGVLSAVQSRILALACTAAFGPVAGEAVSLAIMGSAAASEELRSGIDRGLDRQHAIIGALASGINEALFEKLSLEKFMGNLLDPSNIPKSVFQALGKSQMQRLVEGSEEFFTEIANRIADGLINVDMSDYNSKIRAYKAAGHKDPTGDANKEFLFDILEAAFGGYIAGGGMGAFALNRASSSQFLQPVMGPMVDAYANYQQNRGFRNIGAGVVQNQNVTPLVQGAQQSGNQRLMDLANDIVRNPMYQQSEQVPVQNGQREVEKPTRKQAREYNAAVGKLTSETIQNEANKAFGGNETALKEVIRSEMKSRNLAPQDYMVDVVAQVYNGDEENLSDYGKSVAEKINASEIAEHVRSNAADIEREANRISEESYERLRSVRSMAAADYSDRVSEAGEVIDTATGNSVEIAEIANISKDDDGAYTMTFATKDGKRVNAADIQYADSTQAALYDAVRESGVNAEIGNAMVRAFDQKGTISAYNYVTGMLEGMQYGRTNQTAETASKNGFFADLTPSQKDLAIRFGRYENETAIQEAVKRVNALKSVNNGTGRVGSVDVRSDMAGLNNAQRTGIRAIEFLTENGVLANNFHFFASEEGTVNGHKTRVLTEDLGGKKKGSVAPNGFYETKTGDIYIDLNAGNSGEGTILFTAAHELTHFVKLWSPQKFNDLADFVVQQLHGKGHNVDDLVRDQMRKSGSRNLSYEDAFEEMVADSMQTMFTDGDLMTKLLALKDRDRTLFDKLHDFIKNLQKGIHKVYGDLEPDSREAKYIREMGDAIDRIADMFAQGITEATENYSAAPDAKNLSAEQLAELKRNGFTVRNGLVVAENMADAAAKVVKPGALDYYSYRTEPEWEKSVIAQFGDTPETRRYISAIKAFTNAMVADDAIRKIVPMGSYAYDKYGPLRDNVEYVITFDMDTSCPRTFQFLKYRDAIQAYAKRPLTYNESVNLLELMRAFGQNIPCSYCYVENKRVLLSASYNNFFAFRNNVLNEQDENKAKTMMYGYDEKKGALSKASQKVFEAWRKDMGYNPTVSQVWEAAQKARNSVFNYLDDLLRKNLISIKQPQSKLEDMVCNQFGVKGQGARAEISGIVSEWVYDTYAEKEHTYFLQNNPDLSEVDVRALALNHEALAYAKSASSAKTVSSYVPYTDQLKNISKDVKDYVMGMGGIRKHSSNDFRIDYVQDYMMFYADLAAGGWTGHTYTKSTDFVKIFGRTGDRINMSIAMTDGPNGTVRENALEGMYWKDARALRKAYKNAGVMSMVTSDAQLSYALNSDWIDMAIPFHASSLDKKVWYDLRHWFDYTSKQLERFYNSTEMELALIQKALDDAGVEYSSDGMNKELIEMAKKAGAGGKSDDRAKIMNREIKRLKSLMAKNGVKYNTKMSTTEIEDLYNSTFGVKTLYNAAGKRIKPHFLPGETVVDGVTVPGHNNDVNRYLELCREYGVHPRFDGVAVQDKNGNDINVIDHEGYIKLIKETARTDSEQEKIQFNLDEYDDYLKMTPMEYAMKQLEDYAKIGGYDNLSEDPMGIKQRFIDEYLGQDRPIGWFSEETQDLIDVVNEFQNVENAGDDLPGYMDADQGMKLSTRSDALKLKGVDWMEDHSSIRTQLEKHKAELDAMEPALQIEYAGEIDEDFKNLIRDQIALLGGKSMKRGNVTFDFDEEGIAAIKRHAVDDALRAAALAAPYIAKRGILISGHKNHEGTNTTTLTYAAPMVINGIRANVGVVIQFTTKGRPHAINFAVSDPKLYKKIRGTTDAIRKRTGKSQISALPTLSSSSTPNPTTTSAESQDGFKNSARDQGYMELAQDPEKNKFFLEKMVSDAAREAMPSVAADRRGNPLHLYHGTPRFGFTEFIDSQHEVPFIYTSTLASVAAHYAGDNNYAFARPIGKKYDGGSSLKSIIQDAETVWGSKLKVASEEDKKRIFNDVRNEAVAVADNLDELRTDNVNFNLDWDNDENARILNAIAWVEDIFWTVRDGDNMDSFEAFNEARKKPGELALFENLENFERNSRVVKDFVSEHIKDYDGDTKKYLRYLTGYELGDAAIDIIHKYGKMLDNDTLLIGAGDNLIIPERARESLDLVHNIGAYDLFGNLGERPFDIDTNGAQFWAIKVPEMGDGYYSTDQISKWAYENGYTSVIMRNIYDYGDKADNYVFFNSSQVKSADPVTYDDSGNVIPLSERFNSNNPDIRYSMRDSEGNTLTKAQQDFFQNSEARDKNGNLLLVYHGSPSTDITVFDRSKGGSHTGDYDDKNLFWFTDNEKFADDFSYEMEPGSSAFRYTRGKKGTVYAGYLNIEKMFDLTNPSREVLDYLNRKLGEERAKELLDYGNHQFIKFEIDYNDLKEMGFDGIKANLYTNYQNKPGVEYGVFNSSQFKRADNASPTLSEDIRFSERDLDATDTRTLLSNALLDAAQNDIERKYIEDYQSKISSMNEEQRRLNEIRDEIREMSFGTGKRDMDKLRSLRDEANKLANRINIYDKQLLRIEAMKPMKAVVNRERTRVEADIREQMNARLTDYRNRVSSREYIASIQNEVKGLQTRLLHPKAKTVIPEAFARPVADFLSSIDFTTYYKNGRPRGGMANAKREQIRNSLTALAENLEKNEEHLFDEYNGLDISPDMQQWIKDTVAVFDRITESEGTFTVHQMSPDELKNLYKMLTAIRTAVNKAGKMYTNMSSNVMDLGVGTIEYLKPYIGKERSAVGTRVFKTLGWDYAQPVTAFSRFGDAGKQVYKGLLSGQKKEGENVRKILDFVDTAYTRKEVNDWQKELHTVHIGGMDYQVPVTYIMELYSMMKDKGAVQHITGGGGIRFDDLTYGRTGRKKTKTFANTLITEEEVDAMIAELTPRQKEVASNLQEFMDRVGAEWGNEISLTRFGYHAFGQIENYYPIRTIKGNSEYEAQQKRANIYALLNKSFTKERVENANNAVIIGDAFKTFSNHMSEMAVYNAWALPVIDTIKWFNYKEAQDLDAGTPERSVKDAIRMAYGAERSNPADEYIRRLLESINSQKSGGLSESLAFHNLRMVNRVAVSANIRVAVQQPFSITRAFELLNPKFVRLTTPKTRKEAYEEMLKYSSFGQWKDLGYYDVDISRPLEAEILKNASAADRFTEKTMGLAERGDKFTWATLWHGCKLEAMSKGLTGEAASKAAAEKFDDIIAKTQVVDSVLTKSQWMRSDSFWHRMTSAFMSEPMTSYNTLLRRYDQFVRDAAEHGKQYALKRNGKAIAGTLAVFVLTQLVNALVTAPIDASRDDDDYKTWLEKMLEKFRKSALENLLPTGMMPYISDIVEYAIYGQEDRADIAMYTKLIDFAKQVHSLFTSEDSKQYKKDKAIMQGLSVFSNVSGLPLSNMLRDAIAIYNTTVGDILKVNHGALKFQTSADPNKVGYEQFLKAVKADNTNRMTYINGEMLENGIAPKTALNGVLDLLKTEYEEGADRGKLTKDLDKVLAFFDAEDDAELTMAYWDYDKENPDQDERGMYNITSFRKYYNTVRPDGISLETYEQYLSETDGLKKKEEKMPVIDSLPITDEQKDSLYYLNGWSANTIDEAPWHGGSVAKPGQTEEPEEAVETSLGAKSYQWYTENAEPIGIELSDYEKYYAKREKAKNQDFDGDGKADVTKKEMIVKAIDEMPISKKQKDFLYLRDYSESGLKDTPWHK